jgi:hypothetical protein
MVLLFLFVLPFQQAINHQINSNSLNQNKMKANLYSATLNKMFRVCTLLAFALMFNISAIAQCTGNLTPSITPSEGACGGTVYPLIDHEFTLTLLVNDANNDVLNLNITSGSLPAGATVSPSLPYSGQSPFTITITWTPTQSDYNVPYNVRFTVTDPCTGYNCELTLNANCSNNSTPSIGASIISGGTLSGNTIYGAVGQTTIFSLLIADFNNDVVTLINNAVYPLPASATVTPALPYTAQTPYSVTVTWTPTALESTSPRFTVTEQCTGTTRTLTLNAPCSVPTITCPADITQTANQSGCTASVFYTATANADGDAPDVTYSIAPGSDFPLGTTTVTATATNSCGTASCTFNVTVNSATMQINCPGDVTIPAEASNCQGYYIPFITASSAAGLASLSASPAGPLFPAGTTLVTATAIDSCGSTASCTFNVNVLSGLSVDAGANVSTIFGYASTQTATRTAVVSGGTGPYTYSWTLSRPLKCNQVNSSGDELFTGGSCSNNICGSSTTTPAAPSCSGSSTINATLLADANVCVTVTDANGCTATDCFYISAIDGRCFTGNAGKNKAKICHQTGSASNPWVTICIAKSNANNFIANHPGDYLGPCATRLDNEEIVNEEGMEYLGAFPNPFSNSTTIQFTLPENDFASMKVFDVTGRVIENLYDRATAAGEIYSVEFDGSRFNNGIYFLVLNSRNGVSQTRKLIISR